MILLTLYINLRYVTNPHDCHLLAYDALYKVRRKRQGKAVVVYCNMHSGLQRINGLV